MTKLLKILAVVLLLLGIAALTLGTMLFMKREVLVGRTHKLETSILALGTTIEAQQAEVETKPHFPEIDMSEVTSEVIDSPELSDIWSKYSYELEAQEDIPFLDLTSQEQDLRSFYKIDPVTGGLARDGQGRKIMTGEGTMQAVLDTVLSASEEQLNRLNTTRQQLTDIREEFVSTIEEFNQIKQTQRLTLKAVEGQKQEIARLEGEIMPFKQNIALLEEGKRSLEDTIAEQQRDIGRLQENNADKEATIAALNEQIGKFDSMSKETSTSTSTATTSTMAPGRAFQGTVDPGRKGTVVAVSAEWNFAVVELSDEFMAELLSDESAGIPQVELMIKRPGPADVFVTRVKLIQVKKADRLGICDILPDWQQAPVETGDVAFY